MQLGLNCNFTETVSKWYGKYSAKTPAILLVLLLLFAGAYVSTRVLNNRYNLAGMTLPGPDETLSKRRQPQKIEVPLPLPLNCTAYDLTRTCPSNYNTTTYNPGADPDRPSSATCPEYFRWIHEDLRPWARTGISKDMVERARRTANFRLVIVNGRAYVETFSRAFQTRDVFTLWGILQLLRWYPGRVPDLELLFDCNDFPVIFKKDYSGPNAKAPPAIFHYCGADDMLDIAFPDWSFWGWPDINIKPWVPLMKDLEEGNNKTTWKKREPYAYWKGNPYTGSNRLELLKCNVSKKKDWNARIYTQDWIKELKEGYKQSNLADQCDHRYKIYIEGNSWSVSEKYILACDSVALLVKPRYHDFFTRSLKPMQHYWPIKSDDMCKSIKFAVDWGNEHKKEAQAIGKAASKFMKDELKIELVYDYMFHLLSEYAKLLTFKPTIPEKAVEFCAESMACPANGLIKEYMTETLVTSPSESEPCTMPPPYNSSSLHLLLQRNRDSSEQVEMWQTKYWAKRT